MVDFVEGLCVTCLRRHDVPDRPRPPEVARPAVAPDARVTVAGLFARLASALTPETMVVADPGDALFGAIDLPVQDQSGFLSPAYYASLGFAVPAALGAQLAEPASRPLVLVGDGAFQMTGLELSTIVRYGGTPIVVVLDNQGYGTERPMLDGPFNDVHPWRYSELPALLGAGRGFRVRTHGELDDALGEAAGTVDSYCLIPVELDRDDLSPALQRLTSALGATTRGEPAPNPS
jgi:indolepyruvate decarboxylase